MASIDTNGVELMFQVRSVGYWKLENWFALGFVFVGYVPQVGFGQASSSERNAEVYMISLPDVFVFLLILCTDNFFFFLRRDASVKDALRYKKTEILRHSKSAMLGIKRVGLDPFH